MVARKTPSKGGKPDKLWHDALLLTVNELCKDPFTGKNVKKLRLLARKLVDHALEGGVVAMREIGDRFDGKPSQRIAGDSEKPNELVIRVIDPTKSPEKRDPSLMPQVPQQ